MMTTRADDNGPFKEFTLCGWLRDGVDGMCGDFYYNKVRVDTSGFESHMRTSVKEQLLAARSLIDGMLERIDEAEAGQADPEPKQA